MEMFWKETFLKGNLMELAKLQGIIIHSMDNFNMAKNTGSGKKSKKMGLLIEGITTRIKRKVSDHTNGLMEVPTRETLKIACFRGWEYSRHQISIRYINVIENLVSIKENGRRIECMARGNSNGTTEKSTKDFTSRT
jgi:hypothetical protein